MLYAVCALSVTQLAILIVVIAVAALIVVGNVVLSYYRYKNTERTLCTQQLQQKRNELLAHLEEAKRFGSASAENEQVDEAEEDEDGATEEDEAEEEESDAFTVPTAPVEENASYEILAVKDMSPAMCFKYNINQEENADKRYYVRYVYGFEAKLRSAEPSVQKRYISFVNEIGQYKGVRIKNSFQQQRILRGQMTIGLILFKGNMLSVAFALDPAQYAETKYRGIDMSGVKRFEGTPMLLHLTSEKRLEYAKYLFVQVADANTILLSDEPVEKEYDLSEKSNEELFLMNSLRIKFIGEVPEKEPSEEKKLETVE